MRKLRNLIIWIIISIIIQTGVLYYFDKYHFRNAEDITYKVAKPAPKKETAISVSIPKDATNIVPSYTGKYAYYYSGNSIYVVNMSTGKSNAIKLDVDVNNVCVDWSSTKDSILMLELNSNNLSFKVYTYYPDTNTKEEDRDAENRTRIYDLGRRSILGMKQDNISTLIYIESANSKTSANRYMSTLDISTGLIPMGLPIRNIGSYYIFKPENKLLYEDQVDKKIYISKQNREARSVQTQQVKIDGVDNYKLISVYDKYAYIGKLVNDKISTIYYASIASKDSQNDDNSSSNSHIKSSNVLSNRMNTSDDFTADWQQINLSSPVDPNDIYISSNTGNMYTIDNLKGDVENIKTKKKTQFDGTYVGMSDDYVFSFNSDKGKLIENTLN